MTSPNCGHTAQIPGCVLKAFLHAEPNSGSRTSWGTHSRKCHGQRGNPRHRLGDVGTEASSHHTANYPTEGKSPHCSGGKKINGREMTFHEPKPFGLSDFPASRRSDEDTEAEGRAVLSRICRCVPRGHIFITTRTRTYTPTVAGRSALLSVLLCSIP